MQPRNHPLLTRKSGTKDWPPMWTSPRGDENDRLVGEIGTLQQLSIGVLLDTSLFLFIDYQGSRYTGLLCFDDAKSCYAIYTRLSSMMGRSIKEIGDVDLSNL
jgi:hypothetical protein